jgi:WD40 repeat protein
MTTPCCKEGAADGSPVSQVRWCPAAQNSFITAHANGQLLLYDRSQADDAELLGSSSGMRRAMRVGSLRGASTGALASPAPVPEGPVSSWQVSAAGVTALEFSSDGKLLAIGMADAIVSVFDFAAQAPVLRLHTYFGGVLTCCWSPDSRYLLTGGEDDMIALWSIEDRTLVARGMGHHSWVQSVSFAPEPAADASLPDSAPERAAERVQSGAEASERRRRYRFVSCGSDTRALVWEVRCARVTRPPVPTPAPREAQTHARDRVARPCPSLTRRSSSPL